MREQALGRSTLDLSMKRHDNTRLTGARYHGVFCQQKSLYQRSGMKMVLDL